MDHRIWIDDRWDVWKAFNLRTAGFPVSMLEALGDPGCAARIDAYLDRQEMWACAWNALRSELWAQATSGRPDWREWRRVAQRLKPGRVPDVTWLPDEMRLRLQASVEERATVLAEREQLEKDLEEVPREAWNRLQPVLGQPALREVLAWQNPKVLAQLERFERSESVAARGNAPGGRLVRTLVRYLARYAAKNDPPRFPVWNVR
jgi:hypothetical protein